MSPVPRRDRAPGTATGLRGAAGAGGGCWWGPRLSPFDASRGLRCSSGGGCREGCGGPGGSGESRHAVVRAVSPTYVLEPQVGFHYLVDFVLQNRAASGTVPALPWPAGAPGGRVLTTFTSWDMDTSNWMMTGSETFFTGRTNWL